MPSPCESCKDTCASGKGCGSDCKCGPDCKCAETSEGCGCAAPKKE